tara:strand:- start:5332 stop:6120 length:789 start_codon:yes stop_codon:yes gene_type:complete
MTHCQTNLFQRAGISARLSHYGPGLRMAAHEHGYHQLSCLLAGELRESHAAHDRDIHQPSLGVKPAGLSHTNEYGPNGALILSVNIDPDLADPELAFCLADWRWQAHAVPRGSLNSLLTLANLLGGAAAEADDVLADFLAVLTAEITVDPPRPASAIPDWLNEARDALRESDAAPDLAALAGEAGVHRVHFSRCFNRHFGVPPSLYRRRCRLARAIADMVQGASLADAAAGAGFADQSHFSRLAKAETGYTPGALQSILRAA